MLEFLLFSISQIRRVNRACVSVQRTGAKPGQHIPPIWRVEVPPRVAKHSGAGRPAPPPQNFSGSKPRFGKLLVQVNLESRIRKKIAARPFPHVSNHLPAAEGAVALWKGVHVDAPHPIPIQVCPRRHRRLVAPGETSFLGRKSLTVWLRFRGGSNLPLNFGWESTPCPTTIRFSLIPVDVDDRKVRFEWHPFVKMPTQPAAVRVTLPVDRMFSGN